MNRTVRGLQGQRYRSFRPSEQLFYGEILYRPNFSRPTLTIDLRVFRDVIPKGVSVDPKWQKAFEFDRASVLHSPRQIPAVHHGKRCFPNALQNIPRPDFKTAKNAGVSTALQPFWHLLFLCLLFLLVGLSRFKAQLSEDGDLHLAFWKEMVHRVIQ